MHLLQVGTDHATEPLQNWTQAAGGRPVESTLCSLWPFSWWCFSRGAAWKHQDDSCPHTAQGKAARPWMRELSMIIFFLYKWLPNKASFCCITCKWYESRKMCNESDLEHDWEPHCSLCAFGTRRWWRPERTRQRSTRLENYTAQQLREHHSSSSSSVTSAGLTPCISILSRWNLDLWGGWKGTNVAFLFQYIYIWNIVTPYSDKTLTIYCEADVKWYLLS